MAQLNRLWRRSLLYIGLFIVLTINGVQAEFKQGLLWKVEKEGYTTSYVFGTMHSTDPRVLDLTAQIKPMLLESGQFAMELLFTPDVALKMQMAMFFQDDKRLDQMLDQALFQKLQEQLAFYGIPAPMVHQFKPWAAMITISLPPQMQGEFLDLALHNLARERGKPAFGLETVEEQVAVFENLSLKAQTALLVESIKNHHKLETELEKLTQAYLDRNLALLTTLSEEQMDTVDPAIKEAFMEGIAIKRNHTMVAAMLPLMQRDGTFVAVGALHLPGEEGVLQLLQNRGFKISRAF